MTEVTYSTTGFFTEHLVRLDDPLWSRPWYLKSARNGKYEWTRNEVFAKRFSLKTAQKHVTALRNGADKDWEDYHNEWSNF